MKDTKATIFKRCWINQPSTLQSCHDMDGVNVLAPEVRDIPDDFITVYFVAGKSISARIPRNALSDGWNPRNVIHNP